MAPVYASRLSFSRSTRTGTVTTAVERGTGSGIAGARCGATAIATAAADGLATEMGIVKTEARIEQSAAASTVIRVEKLIKAEVNVVWIAAPIARSGRV